MRKGFAPVFFGVLIVAFSLFTIAISLVGGEKVYDRSTNDIQYQQPINQMELVHKFMKQALLFSAYQGSAQVLETAGLDSSYNYSHSAPRNNIDTPYWYDTRTNTEVHAEKNRIHFKINNSVNIIMGQYVDEAGSLMSRIGGWTLPNANQIAVNITDSCCGSSYNYSGKNVVYQDDKMRLDDLNNVFARTEYQPLTQLDKAVDGLECLISNKHEIGDTRCTTMVASVTTKLSPPETADNLHDRVRSCIDKPEYKLSGSGSNSNCGGGYPAYPSNEEVFRQAVGMTVQDAENRILGCTEDVTHRNAHYLTLSHESDKIKWKNDIHHNSSDVTIYNCKTSQSTGACNVGVESKVFDTDFPVDSSHLSGWNTCINFYVGRQASANHFCRYKYGSEAYATSCYYETGTPDRYEYDVNQPEPYQGNFAGYGTAITMVKCERPRYDTEYTSTKTCSFRYETEVDLVSNSFYSERQYPFFSKIDNPLGETKYRDMALRFLVYIKEIRGPAAILPPGVLP